MKIIGRLIRALLGFAIGAALAVFLVGRYVSATYVCTPGATEPCDAGGLVGMGLVMTWASISGLVFAAAGYWLALRQERRRAT